MFSFFNQNTQSEEPVGLLNALLDGYVVEEDEAPAAQPIVTVVQTSTTKVSIRTADATIEVEQTDTTVTTAPLEVFLEGDEDELPEVEELEGVYFVDVDLVDTYATRSLLNAAIAEYCATNYAKAEVVNRNGPIVTVRFMSPLRSSVEQMAIVAGADEDTIAWMTL